MNAVRTDSAGRFAAYSQAEAVSPLFAEIHAQYGAAFDAALAPQRRRTRSRKTSARAIRLAASFPPTKCARARVIVREDAVLCGVPWFNAVLRQVDPRIEATVALSRRRPHDSGHAGVRTARAGPRAAYGRAQRAQLPAVAVRRGERHAPVRRRDRGIRARILDTRKTLPGLRLAQKYAVRVGGGANQRLALYDGILIKENHIAAAGGVGAAMNAALALNAGVLDSDRGRKRSINWKRRWRIARQSDSARQLFLRCNARRGAHHRWTRGAGSVGRRQLRDGADIAETGVDRVSIGAPDERRASDGLLVADRLTPVSGNAS